MARKAAAKSAAKRAIPKGLERALAERRPGADAEQLLNDLIDVWGGTRMLAVDLHAEFQHAGKGGMTRQRIMEMIQRLIINNTNNDIGRSKAPSDMTTEELEAVAMEYVKRLSDGPAGAPAEGTGTA